MLRGRRQFPSKSEHTAAAAVTRIHTCSSEPLRPRGQRPPSRPWKLSMTLPLLSSQRAWCTARISNRRSRSRPCGGTGGLRRPLRRKLDSMDCGSEESPVFCFFESFPPPEPAQRPMSTCRRASRHRRNGPTCATTLPALGRLLVQVLFVLLVEVPDALCAGSEGSAPLVGGCCRSEPYVPSSSMKSWACCRSPASRDSYSRSSTSS